MSLVSPSCPIALCLGLSSFTKDCLSHWIFFQLETLKLTACITSHRQKRPKLVRQCQPCKPHSSLSLSLFVVVAQHHSVSLSPLYSTLNFSFFHSTTLLSTPSFSLLRHKPPSFETSPHEYDSPCHLTIPSPAALFHSPSFVQPTGMISFPHSIRTSRGLHVPSVAMSGAPHAFRVLFSSLPHSPYKHSPLHISNPTC